MLVITNPAYLTNFGGFILELVSDNIIVSLFYYWRIKAEVTSLGSYTNSQYDEKSKKYLV